MGIRKPKVPGAGGGWKFDFRTVLIIVLITVVVSRADATNNLDKMIKKAGLGQNQAAAQTVSNDPKDTAPIQP